MMVITLIPMFIFAIMYLPFSIYQCLRILWKYIINGKIVVFEEPKISDLVYQLYNHILNIYKVWFSFANKFLI